MKESKQFIRYVTRAALVAALYVALTMISAIFSLSSGAVQVRISEALCILPIFMPEAVVGLTLGCLISNLIVSGIIWDVVFGTVATLIGAVGAYILRKLPHKFMWCATLPTVLANALIIPPVLIFAFGESQSYVIVLALVALGEIISASVLGSTLYYALKKRNIKF